MINEHQSLNKLKSSFRDSQNFVFEHENQIFRALSETSFEAINIFLKSELYKILLTENKIIETNIVSEKSFKFKSNFKYFIQHKK